MFCFSCFGHQPLHSTDLPLVHSMSTSLDSANAFELERCRRDPVQCLQERSDTRSMLHLTSFTPTPTSILTLDCCMEGCGFLLIVTVICNHERLRPPLRLSVARHCLGDLCWCERRLFDKTQQIAWAILV